MTLRSLLLSTTLVASLFSGFAEAAPRLKSEAVVESDQIRLGDLIDGLETGTDIAVFAAPAPGARGTIRAERVIAAAREMGIRDIEAGSLRSIAISRPGRAITRNDMQDAIARVALERGARGNLDVVIDDQFQARTIDIAKPGFVRVAHFARDTRTGRFEARLALSDTESWMVTGLITEMREIAILANDIDRGEAVQAKDIILVRRPANQLSNDIIGSASDLVGMIPRRLLRAGDPIRQVDLAKPLLVEKNQLVSVTYASKGLSLIMRGRAQQSGAMGETIRIQNPQSKRIIEGIVTGQAHVTITNITPPTAPVADATASVRQ